MRALKTILYWSLAWPFWLLAFCIALPMCALFDGFDWVEARRRQRRYEWAERRMKRDVKKILERDQA